MPEAWLGEGRPDRLQRVQGMGAGPAFGRLGGVTARFK